MGDYIYGRECGPNEKVVELRVHQEALNRVENYEELMAQLEEVVVFPEIDDDDWKLKKMKEILGLTHERIYAKRMRGRDEGRSSKF